jgi:uncharacterized protein YodC (DUF2158 family)
MRITTTALLAAIAFGGAAYAQSAPTPPAATGPANRAPATAQTTAGTPSLVVGDIVRLKSGSPEMSVVEIGADVQVVWYSREKGPQRERFPEAVLEKSDLGESIEDAPPRQREASSSDRDRDDRQMDRPRREDDRYRDRRSEGRYEGRRESRYGDRDWGHRCDCDDNDDDDDRDYRR